MCYNDKKVIIVNTVKEVLNKYLDLPEVYVKNTIMPQITVTFVIKTANLTVTIIRPDIILKNTTHKMILKYDQTIIFYCNRCDF